MLQVKNFVILLRVKQVKGNTFPVLHFQSCVSCVAENVLWKPMNNSAASFSRETSIHSYFPHILVCIFLVSLWQLQIKRFVFLCNAVWSKKSSLTFLCYGLEDCWDSTFGSLWLLHVPIALIISNSAFYPQSALWVSYDYLGIKIDCFLKQP
jgi:hypothetical protein